MRYRLLALDLDGTILDAGGVLRDSVRDSIRAVAAGGVRVVLATGRRYRTTRPVLEQLELSGPVVIQNGVLVKDAATGETLAASYVPAHAYPKAFSLLSALGPPAVYVDEAPSSNVDLVATRGGNHHPYLSEYLSANREQTRFVDSLAGPPSDAVTMISAMAGRDELAGLQETLAKAPIPRIQTNLIENKSYRGHILEIVSVDTGKWRRLQEIALREGIDSSEIIAIGDDANDQEMIERAGLGIAMENANSSVRAAADHVTASNDNDGAALAIREFLL